MSCVCQTFSELNVPKIITIDWFLTKLFKNKNGGRFWNTVWITVLTWSVLERTPVLKYSYMLMTQKYIKWIIRNQSDQQKLQTILNMIKSWSDEWLIRLNIDKCKCVSYCIKHPTDTGYHIMDRNQLFPLDKVESMVDLGVGFDNNLTFRDHISEKN